MIESVFSQLLQRLVNSGFDRLKVSKDFLILKRLAHERICRELFWNLECISNSRPDERSVYLSLMRTDAFDDLVKLGAPMDDIFGSYVFALNGPPASALSKQLRRRLKGVNLLSHLLDRTYNRIWMLRHRVTHGLELGDISYLRQLLKLSLAETANFRDACIDGHPIASRNPGPPMTFIADSDSAVW